MSMFDTLRCDYPLPARAVAQTLLYHTKSFHCTMDEMHIREDGSLWGQDYDIEDHSDPEASGIARIAGMMTRVNVQPVFMGDFHGVVNFYSDYGTRDKNGRHDGWLEFEAVFSGGQLRSIKLIEDRVPASILAEEAAEALDKATFASTGISQRRM